MSSFVDDNNYADNFKIPVSETRAEHLITWLNSWYQSGTFPSLMLGVYGSSGMYVVRSKFSSFFSQLISNFGCLKGKRSSFMQPILMRRVSNTIEKHSFGYTP